MKWMFGGSSVVVGLLAVAAFSLAGCGTSETAQSDHDEHGHAHEDEQGHVHGEWWCSEHGVPEDVCARCDTSLIAEFKEEGDWCEEHNRPDSQCFVCSPELFEKFAARYKAKYGDDPPKPEDLEEDSDS